MGLNVILEVGNLTEDQVNKIIREFREHNTKVYKRGTQLRLEFSLESARVITLDEFTNKLYKATGMILYVKVKDKLLHFRFDNVEGGI